jgi:NAD(P)-dependent dehydrogenase (short-subunit alcohol dehydrogenase family)
MPRHLDRRVLITGAANGIGRATAEFFAAEGAKLFLIDLPETGLPTVADSLSTKVQVEYRELSVTDDAAVSEALAQMVSLFGGVDGVVNSAGIVVVEPALEADLAAFRRVVDVNLTGSWIVCQAAAKHMVSAGSGSIVNISSVYGFQGALSRTAYCASKGGVVNLTDSLAVEWGPLGIRVNSVAPTGTRTQMVQKLIDRGIYNIEAVSRRTPLRRLAEPEEVAYACGFLIGDEAQMITGHHLRVDGGWLANGYIS